MISFFFCLANTIAIKRIVVKIILYIKDFVSKKNVVRKIVMEQISDNDKWHENIMINESIAAILRLGK